MEERLEEYSQRFDVVLLGDGDLSYVVALLNELVGEENGGGASEGGGNGEGVHDYKQMTVYEHE